MGEIREFRSLASGVPWLSVPGRLAAVVVGAISDRPSPRSTDEAEETRGRIKWIDRELIPSIHQHHGTLIICTADRFIAIFENPVEAAQCGVIIRQSIVERNQLLPRRRWIQYRIGVDLGQVITDTNKIYGEGVYAASGLAAIAGPGQLCISGGLYEQIKHKLFYTYESLGDREVKNIAKPVTVYRMLADPDSFNKNRTRYEIILLSLVSLILTVIAGGGMCYLFGQGQY